MIFWGEKIQRVVESFVKKGKIPHAILIEGENTKHTTALADYIAGCAVCCGESKPCGECRDCHLAGVGTHPDITTIKTLDGKKNLSVDQIREARADAFVKAHSAANRVFIIEEAHRMNAAGQNALLKVLEEPPQNVIFILLTPSKTMLLDTIISRCVLLSVAGNENADNQHFETANSFIDLLLTGSEYDMLKLLAPLEKSRRDAEEFFVTLGVCAARRLRTGSIHARVLDQLFEDTKYYLDLLSTNINMPLLLSLAVSRSKGLLDK